MADRAVVDTPSPLTVVLDSGDEAIPALTLASYAPTAGDRVAVDKLGSQVVVLGATVASAWVTPTLENDWEAMGAGYQAPAYRAMADGTVMLRGHVKNGTAGTTVFQLPAGLIVAGSGTEAFTTSAGPGLARVDASAGGAIRVVAYHSGGTNANVSLSGIRYSNTD